jgi:ABC-2 type transporter
VRLLKVLVGFPVFILTCVASFLLVLCRLQYLTLIPEYMIERRVIMAEANAGIIGYFPYVLSSMLTEIPRASVQCCVLIGIVYMFHPLNPDPVNQTFCVVCLIVGVCAWQSLITVCAVVTDSAAVAYSLTFLVLGRYGNQYVIKKYIFMDIHIYTYISSVCVCGHPC